MIAPIGTPFDAGLGHRHKRASKRRWKARARIGRMVPMTAIVEHRLERWVKAQPYLTYLYNIDAVRRYSLK